MAFVIKTWERLVKKKYKAACCFWVEFRVLVLTNKALHGLGGLNYLRNCLSQITSTHPIRSAGEGLLQVPLAMDLHLMDPGIVLSLLHLPYEIFSSPHSKLDYFHLFWYFRSQDLRFLYVVLPICYASLRVIFGDLGSYINLIHKSIN